MKKLVGVSLLAFSLSFAYGASYGTLGKIPLSKPLVTTVNPPKHIYIKPSQHQQRRTMSSTRSAPQPAPSIRPASQFVFNPQTDAISAVNNDQGQLVYYLVYKKSDAARNLVYFNDRLNQVSGNDAEHYNMTVTDSNSYGGWVYFDSTQGGFKSGCTFASRNGHYKYFNFTVNSQGLMTIETAITYFSSGEVRTTKPIPLDKWVYIQGYQLGENYQLGWKDINGEQHIVSGQIRILESRRDTHYIDLNGVERVIRGIYPIAFNFHTCATRSAHFFWHPSEPMLAGYNIKNFSSAEVRQGLYYNLDTRLLNDINNAFLNNTSPIKPNMVVVYTSDDGTIIAIDLRETPYPDFTK